MKIAIAGFGVEGESNYRYFAGIPGNDITIVDEQEGLPSRPFPDGAITLVGPDSFKQLENFELVVRTAGLNPNKIVTDGKIWSATNEFFEKCPAPIIGVTASKGKGTICSLIASILQAGGKDVHLVGNIGVPALDELNNVKTDDIVVYELSSFQLWDLQKSPHIAVVGMIEPEHLDVHADMDEYIAAKGNITSHQTANDVVFANNSNPYAKQIANLSLGSKLLYPYEHSVHVADGFFWAFGQKVCPVSALKLPGQHNVDNACAAIAAVWEYIQDGGVIAKGLESFTGLPHRLKFVAEKNEVGYYDDSIASTPGSAIAAVKAFKQPIVMIMGGSSKGADFNELAGVFSQSVNLKHVILIGQEATNISKAFDGAGFSHYENLGSNINMSTIVAKANAAAVQGDAVVLSPACASFDMFKNYSDRGDQFIAAVNSL